MIQKKAGVFLGSLFLVVLLLGVVSGQSEGNCSIIERASCVGTDNYTIFGLSGVTNAHGQVWDATPQYTHVLCCNLPQTAVSRSCTGVNKENKVIGLSSTTNAHAEIPHPASPSYTITEICFGDLICESGTTQPAGKNAILSLSGTTGTNAHVGNPGAYSMKIWCNVDYLGTYCGDGVVQSPNDLGTGGTLNDGFEDCDDGNNIDDDACSNNCEVTGIPLEPEAYWASSKTTDSYLYTEELYIGYTTIYMILKNSGLAQGTEISFEIYERDTLGSQDIRVGADTRKGIVDSAGKVVGNWTVSYTDMQNADNFLEGDEYEFYFKADDVESNELTATVKEAPFCPTISLCMDYSAPDSCGSDPCKRAALSVELNSDITCGGDITCECWWDETAGTCNSRWSASGIGSCKNGEGVTEECTENNLFFKYSWTATWTWDEGANQQDQDNLALAAKCVGGSNVLPCPAQIQLPFFNIYNIIAIIVVIVLIYFLLNLKKKKRKVSKKKK